MKNFFTKLIKKTRLTLFGVHDVETLAKLEAKQLFYLRRYRTIIKEKQQENGN
jgi:hypothetical protein